MEIENITLEGLKTDIETLNKKYDIYINDYEFEKQIRSKFIRQYSHLHSGIEVAINSELEKKIAKCNTYKEYEEVLDEHFGNTTEKRIKQLIDKFSISEQKYFKNSMYNISKMENVENELRSKIKTGVITFKHYVSQESYHVSARATWEDNFMDLMNLLFEYPKFKTSYDLHSLEDLTTHINKSQENYSVKFYKNGNLDISIFNQEDFNKFKEIFITDFMKSINNLKKNW